MKKLFIICCCGIVLLISQSQNAHARSRGAEGVIIGSAVGLIVGAAIAGSNNYPRYYDRPVVAYPPPPPRVVYQTYPTYVPQPVVYVEPVVQPVRRWSPGRHRGWDRDRRNYRTHHSRGDHHRR